jgi:hypothetical protein
MNVLETMIRVRPSGVKAGKAGARAISDLIALPPSVFETAVLTEEI